MEITTLVKAGLISGIAVAIVTALVILVRASAIADLRTSMPSAAGFSSESLWTWVVTWAAITLVFGVVAAWVYSYAASKWSWGPTEYLVLAVVLAALLTALLFVKIYDGETHAFKVEYTVFNFVYAIGFGTMVPKLVG